MYIKCLLYKEQFASFLFEVYRFQSYFQYLFRPLAYLDYGILNIKYYWHLDTEQIHD